MSRQINIWNFNSICRKMTKESVENEIVAKGNNSCKSRSNETKVTLDLYYVKTNPYTKFQVNILKDDWGKFGKPSGRTPSGLTDGRTDWRTDRWTDGRTEWQTARKPIVPPVSPVGDYRGLIIVHYCSNDIFYTAKKPYTRRTLLFQNFRLCM